MANSGTVIAIKVNFELNTPNGLRRVVFGLEKDTKQKEKIVVWLIHFQLFERKKVTDQFGDPMVKLDVEVDKELFDKAETTSKKKALSAGQTAHVLGPAANDAKAAEAGDIDQEDANETIQNTLRK
jgi:hypothetical protein